ncbi:MAG: conjugal transfer protein TraD [Lentisphaerota bacterium]
MQTNTELIKARQKTNRSQLQLAKLTEKDRKLDAHRKIQFGGLVIKAGMDKYPKNIILGALIDALQNINSDESALTLYKAKGDRAFLIDTKTSENQNQQNSI